MSLLTNITAGLQTVAGYLSELWVLIAIAIIIHFARAIFAERARTR